MFDVLRRVAEARRELRAAEGLGQEVTYTVSPWARIVELSSRRYNIAFGAVFGVLASVVAHVSALVLIAVAPLSLIGGDYLPEPPEVVLLEEEEVVPPEEVLEPELDLARPDDEQHENVMEALSMSVAPDINRADPLDTVSRPNVLDSVDVVPDPLQPLEGYALSEVDLKEGFNGEEIATVEGAVDRITHEIARNVERHGDVDVYWLMDASLSLVEEREQVAQNLERVFDELGQLEELGTIKKDAVESTVIRFGQGADALVEPTSDGAAVIAGIRNVKSDESGVENTFTTIFTTVERYRHRVTRERRKMMIVVWTDESGDDAGDKNGNDYTYLDSLIGYCQRFDVPVYVVGPSAMFGQTLGARPYVHPEDGNTYQLPLNRGPDAMFQERINLPYWFDGGQLTNLYSGLGPYALTRLCRETGGAYFIKDYEGGQSPYRLETMLTYVPEYTSAGEYRQLVRHSKLRTAVMQAVEIFQQHKGLKGTPKLEFEPTGATFQTEMLDAQKSVAFNLQAIDQALALFGTKGMEDEYAKEKSARWRAWYDLTYGRLLAMHVRNLEYNWACAVMKGKGQDFVDKKSNRWRFVPDEEIRFGYATKRDADEAKRLLTRCVSENPGTPWAELAQRELQFPLGFEVEERYVAPPPPPENRPGVNNPNPIPPPPPRGRRTEQLRELPRPKPPVLPKL
jgi:hypothetical protein